MTTSAKTRSLDRIDRTILDTLQKDGRISNVELAKRVNLSASPKDGRISNVELAKRVNLSASPCIDRVRKLEQDGFIEGYGAKLNASKLGLGTAAFIQVTLDRTTGAVFDEFRDAVVQIAEVAECHMVAGGFDYLLKLRLSSMEAYRAVLGRIVDLPGVLQTHTYVVIEKVKQDTGLPIAES